MTIVVFIVSVYKKETVAFFSAVKLCYNNATAESPLLCHIQLASAGLP